MNKKLNYLDALRGWAILGVLLVHAGALTGGKASILFGEGARGVQLFYVLSAITLFMSWHNRQSTESTPVLFFFIRRFFRIAPLFYLVLLSLFLRDRFFSSTPPQISFSGFVSTVFFVNGFSPYYINRIVHVEWSIAVEMMFYAIMPLLLVYIKELKAALTLTVFSLFAQWGMNSYFTHHPLINNQPLWNDYLFLWFPNHFPAFCVGIIAYFLLKREPDARYHVWFLLSGLLGIIFLVTGPTLPVIPHHIQFCFGFLLIILALSLKESRILVNKPFIYLGQISFSCYLLHFPMAFAINKLLLRASLPSWEHFLLLLSMMLVTTITLASLTFRFIEIPGILCGRAIIKYLDKSRTPARPAYDIE